jgi:hypothetical protein
MKPAHKLLFENNLHESHWGLRIIYAELDGGFDDDDECDASQWLSCACGKLDDHIEVVPEGTNKAPNSPIDRILFTLGNDFANAVEENPDRSENVCQFYESAQILIKIEARSIELLKMMQDSLK